MAKFPSLPKGLSRQCYSGMMNAMDTAVGKIDDAVRADTKLYEHSIMIFSTVRKASGLTISALQLAVARSSVPYSYVYPN